MITYYGEYFKGCNSHDLEIASTLYFIVHQITIIKLDGGLNGYFIFFKECGRMGKIE